jgi:hypothetical protein
MSLASVNALIDAGFPDNNNREGTAQKLRDVLKLTTGHAQEAIDVSEEAIDLFNEVLDPARNSAVQAEASAAAAAAIVQGSATTRPSIRPTLLVHFANADMFDPRLIVTRDSIGTCFDERGFRVTRKAHQIRYEHDPITGGRLGALKEAAATNLYLHSGAISAANGWALSAALTPTLNDAEGLDGTLSAERLTVGSVGEVFFRRANSTNLTIGQNYTRWGVFRAGTSISIAVETDSSVYSIADGLTKGTTYNLLTGVISGFTTRAFMFPLRDGWYICGRTDQALAASTIGDRWFVGFYGSNSNVGEFLHVDGMQMELGSFPTSYIPTGATAVIRALETWVMPNVEDIIKPGEGSFYAEGITGYGSATLAHTLLFASTNNSVDKYLIVGQRSPTLHRTTIAANPTNASIQWNLNSALTSIGQRVRYALGYRVNDIAVSYNGEAVQVDTVATIPPINTIEIGGLLANGAQAWSGIVVCVAYYSRRLPNTELQALTTSGLLAGKNPNQLPTVGDLGDVATASWKQLLGTLLPTLTIQELRYSVGNPAKAVLISDGAKVGIFVRDNADTSSADDGQNIIITSDAVPVRFKRRQLLRGYTPTSGADTTMELGSVVYDSDFLHVKTAGATIQKLQMPKSGATGARPATSALPVPYMYYDTTLSKPVWWNGTVWKDATGATV